MDKPAWPAFLCAAIAALPAAADFRFFDPEDAARIPASLSATGFYDDISAKKVTSRAVAYEVNTPLWSDGAAKRRWVVLKPGTRIRFAEVEDYYGYPDGAVFVKEFAMDTLPGNPSSRLLLETRLLVNKKDAAGADHWIGFSYRWDRQGRDARLVSPDSGHRDAVRIWPRGTGKPFQMKKWSYPSRSQCTQCHLEGYGDTPARSVLGFFTAQLNRNLPGNAGNQLNRFFDIGLFEPVASRPDYAKAPRWAALGDTSASLELRARSYLAANCSGCHGDRGLANGGTSGMCQVNFDFHDMKRPQDPGVNRNGALEYQYTSWGEEGKADSSHIVTPKRPDLSSIIYRQRDENKEAPGADATKWPIDPAFDWPRAAMPILGRYEADTAALKVLSAWINSLPEANVSIHSRGGTDRFGRPLVSGREIRFGEGAGNPAQVYLLDMRGRRFGLEPKGAGRFRAPATAAPGLYVVRAEGGRAYRIVLP